jgi:hypothetical protein
MRVLTLTRQMKLQLENHWVFRFHGARKTEEAKAHDPSRG